MIEWAGIGVAMGNAVDEVKAVADYITLSNNDDGIAAALEHFSGKL
jgi:hydroxymethylpyrimidine pyrophosphatase-like HAD family hydrolase